ncbi:type I-E CRISPR-associated protein Cas6/Cse3/CasE [Salmonella enterica subsp. enterica serovar Redlands]|nr:type I-E CRISPR-associated protein Cas6/Cse3/CasE [Salmonella enterica subsp. enterica serovar Redlands]
MIFYENALRMRFPHDEIYRIHQHLDTYIQEHAGIKTPYSFKIVPGFASDSAILLRTVQPLNLPGERKHEILLKKEDVVQFSTTLAVMQREMTGNRRRQITPPPERLKEYISNRLVQAGFSVTSLVVGEPENVIIKKRGRPILIPSTVLCATCAIRSVEEAEKALVYGVGRKRIFGFGFLTPFTVNTADESY